MYRYCSGDGGWNGRAFFQDKLATVNGWRTGPMTRTEGPQRSVQHKGEKGQSNNNCEAVYKKTIR